MISGLPKEVSTAVHNAKNPADLQKTLPKLIAGLTPDKQQQITEFANKHIGNQGMIPKLDAFIQVVNKDDDRFADSNEEFQELDLDQEVELFQNGFVSESELQAYAKKNHITDNVLQGKLNQVAAEALRMEVRSKERVSPTETPASGKKDPSQEFNSALNDMFSKILKDSDHYGDRGNEKSIKGNSELRKENPGVMRTITLSKKQLEEEMKLHNVKIPEGYKLKEPTDNVQYFEGERGKQITDGKGFSFSVSKDTNNNVTLLSSRYKMSNYLEKK